MKEKLKVTKQEMKNKVRPYQIYGYYFAIPVVIIALFILSILGINIRNTGTIIFAFTIIAHVGVSKLKLVSKRKYVAPILMYVAEAIGFILVVLMLSEISNGGTGDIYLGLMGLTIYPIEIIAIIFFFITANDIKKSYPTMKEESKNARVAYLTIKKMDK
ncbi:hypothetical protein [Enterococcus rivorum]|uniref:Uncharacterized protein n=1 Tax=Enterococcus rivorum TaxID=762845 RepID=A0A1E5KXJ4_9ENTE|nr:hypothetical protein [Enterococcus rivorum]MBP2099852.1 hypothetical protein [Enterococcus rivorum]OEH82528.1 hypothetical protein BCR26_13230 [Enterococcus rivorum]